MLIHRCSNVALVQYWAKQNKTKVRMINLMERLCTGLTMTSGDVYLRGGVGWAELVGLGGVDKR